MSGRAVYRYRFECGETGVTGPPQIFEHFVWDVDEPVKCPDSDPMHIFDASSITIVDKIEEQTVKIQQEEVPTGGAAQAIGQCYEITCATGASQSFTKTFPMPINLSSAQIATMAENTGDMFEVAIAPNTTIGVLAADAPTGATGIYVSQSVIDNLEVGHFITITDGTGAFDAGQACCIDKVNNYVHLENITTGFFSASSPTYIQRTIKFAHTVHMGPPMVMRFADENIGAAYIPAKIPIVTTYWNNTGGPKRFFAYGLYLY